MNNSAITTYHKKQMRDSRQACCKTLHCSVITNRRKEIFMRSRQIIIAAAALFLGLLLLACSLSGATQTPFAKEGHWEGRPAVSFDVTADGEVINFKIMIAGECKVSMNGTFSIDANHVLQIGDLDSAGKPANNGILGTFDSPTAITGLVANPWECGSASAYTSIFLPAQLATWNAEWKTP